MLANPGESGVMLSHMRHNFHIFTHMRHNLPRTQEPGNQLALWRFWRKRPRPGRLVAIAAVAAFILSANAISSSAAESNPSEGAILIAGLPKFACPAGTVKLTPSSARRTVHGADVYHYAMKSGPGFDS
jgi:hypothetical protein